MKNHIAEIRSLGYRKLPHNRPLIYNSSPDPECLFGQGGYSGRSPDNILFGIENKNENCQ